MVRTVEHSRPESGVLGPGWLRLLLRCGAIAVALVAAWIVYMIEMMATVYDGCLSLLLQPFMGVLTSVFLVGAALLVGLVLKVPGIAAWWRGTQAWAAAMAVGSVLVLLFGRLFGLGQTVTRWETGAELEILRPDVAMVAYFGLVFALANWPFPPSQRPWRWLRWLSREGRAG